MTTNHNTLTNYTETTASFSSMIQHIKSISSALLDSLKTVFVPLTSAEAEEMWVCLDRGIDHPELNTIRLQHQHEADVRSQYKLKQAQEKQEQRLAA